MGEDYLTPTERKLDDTFIEWADREDLDRNQTAYVDVYWVLGAVGNGGIHGFWEGALAEQADRILESFRIAGEEKFADMLDRSRFILDAELDDEGYYRLSEEENDLISSAEDLLYAPSFIERLLSFLERITTSGEPQR
jgi:hypothetical protein